MNESNAPNPFECAKRIVGVSVMLKPDDIVRVLPNSNIAAAERLLDAHASIIAVRMLNAGISASMEIMTREGSGS